MSDQYEQEQASREYYYRKTEVRGRIFAVLDRTAEDRSLTLIPQISRTVRRGEMLELITTDEEGRGPGATVNRVACLGFMEVTEGGLVLSGDTVSIDKEDIGEIIGYDDTPMPDHLNVVIRVKTRQTGRAADIHLNALVKVSALDETSDKQIGF